jgi:hypothetical protein
LNATAGRIAGKFGGAEFARRKIESGESDAIAEGCDGGQEVVLLGGSARSRGGAGSDYAGHFAADQLFCEARVFDLFANRDFEAAADQLGDIAFGGVIGNAAHRDVDAFFLVARSEGDLQLASSEDGIVEESS